jgi:hypothetical protein
MSRLFQQVDLSHAPPSGAIRLAVADLALRLKPHCGARCKTDAAFKFPRRPDLSILNESIPLFYVGQNRNGLWVVREAEGRSGGVFLLRRSARRFARKRSKLTGCATMFLNEPFELDIENQGGRFVVLLAAVVEVAARRAPALAAFVGMMAIEWRKLVAEIARAFSDDRRNRAALERELFRGEYTLSSKNDDDLPVP